MHALVSNLFSKGLPLDTGPKSYAHEVIWRSLADPNAMVVIPTYNEKNNIERLTKAILDLKLGSCPYC